MILATRSSRFLSAHLLAAAIMALAVATPAVAPSVADGQTLPNGTDNEVDSEENQVQVREVTAVELQRLADSGVKLVRVRPEGNSDSVLDRRTALRVKRAGWRGRLDRVGNFFDAVGRYRLPQAVTAFFALWVIRLLTHKPDATNSPTRPGQPPDPPDNVGPTPSVFGASPQREHAGRICNGKLIRQQLGPALYAEDCSTVDNPLALTSRLDSCDAKEAAIRVYRDAANRWPEDRRYFDSCIEAIRQRQSVIQ